MQQPRPAYPPQQNVHPSQLMQQHPLAPQQTPTHVHPHAPHVHQHAGVAPTAQQPTAQANGAPPAPKRKRVQVPAACMQCKKAHAACSYTRPCDRCVRINQAAACVSSPFPTTLQHPAVDPTYIESTPFNPMDTSLTGMEPPAALNAPPNQISESELSRYLFEDTTDFSNMSADFPIFESVEQQSPCGSNLSSSTSGSPAESPLPSPGVVGTPPQPASSIPSPHPTSTPNPNITPAFPSGQANMSAASLASAIAQNVANSQNFSAEVIQSNIPPPNPQLESMMAEMMAQNKRMENLVSSMTNEMQTLKREMVSLKGGSNMVTRLDKTGVTVPGTAVWSIQEGVLLEYNEKFCNIIELKEIPQGYRMHHFFGGPCSNAAKARMNQHLANLHNSQPATDYAVVERKKLSGETMRLMIVVNVIPTPLPVFLTIMWEL